MPAKTQAAVTEPTVTLPVSQIVALVEELLGDFDNLAALIGQCGYHVEMQDTSNRVLAEMLYLGESACRLSKADALRNLATELMKDGGLS